MFTTITPIATRVDPADVSLPPTRSISLGRCWQPAATPSESRHRAGGRDAGQGGIGG
ncbi:hypothetical protein [Curtobacterium herbarum]|uniref:Uncharacterized protein n=1 Tax=Curtobacterium herbarum TaxID=150122 RepID=A0ABN1ZBW8_9MICO|nr:hypothetical protein [Curtobacterium herbarum]MBM7473843.1 hypothetical protein [Curtobacterium herbarum]MCS6544828.1 hypothetical protein [Curtobacterium herbarum]